MPIDLGVLVGRTRKSSVNTPFRPGRCSVAILLLAASLLAGCSDAASKQKQKKEAAAEQAAQQPAPSDTATASGGAAKAPPSPAAAAEAEAPAAPADSVVVPDSIDAPAGTVYVPGGTTRIGITEKTWRKVQRMSNPSARRLWGRRARPSFRTEVAPFFLETHPVTVAQFRSFVEATGYETQAESFGNAGVMQHGRWRLVDGADWQHPRGPSTRKAPDDHPVTQVSWNDAQAYCEWTDRRLPTEVEWEHAARGATNDRALCPDGTCPRPGGEPVANVWQGRFPVENTVADGFRYTAPVETFGETKLGLTGMSGNVWEWTSSWFRPYDQRGTPFRPTKQSEKVQRGGSFQCAECGGYRVFSRSHATRETSLFHVGFRCAKDA
jgi:sulfatase modifying factor 1